LGEGEGGSPPSRRVSGPEGEDCADRGRREGPKKGKEKGLANICSGDGKREKKAIIEKGPWERAIERREVHQGSSPAG